MIKDNLKTNSNYTEKDSVLKSVEIFVQEGKPAYIPSNDSENVAELLDTFQYNKNKAKEVLSKYENVDRVSKNIKSLKLKNI